MHADKTHGAEDLMHVATGGHPNAPCAPAAASATQKIQPDDVSAAGSTSTWSFT